MAPSKVIVINRVFWKAQIGSQNLVGACLLHPIHLLLSCKAEGEAVDEDETKAEVVLAHEMVVGDSVAVTDMVAVVVVAEEVLVAATGKDTAVVAEAASVVVTGKGMAVVTDVEEEASVVTGQAMAAVTGEEAVADSAATEEEEIEGSVEIGAEESLDTPKQRQVLALG